MPVGKNFIPLFPCPHLEKTCVRDAAFKSALPEIRAQLYETQSSDRRHRDIDNVVHTNNFFNYKGFCIFHAHLVAVEATLRPDSVNQFRPGGKKFHDFRHISMELRSKTVDCF